MKADPELLHEFFVRAARAHPDRVAIEVPPGPKRPERRRMAYGELDAWSDAIALKLAEYVVGECLVALLLPRDAPALFAAQLAALKAGAAFVSLDPAFPDEHLRAIVEDAAPVAILTDADGLPRTPGDGPTIDVAGIEPIGTPAPRAIAPDRLAYVIYTSGTTGRPKGVMIEHRGIANLVGDDLATFGITPADRVAQGSSAAYDSSIEETWLAFAAGATLVVMDDDTARLGPDLVPWLRRERITVLCPPPTLLRATGCESPATALPDLRLLYVGGEELPRDLADRWAQGRRMDNGYGPTECTVTVTRAAVRPGLPVSIGRPVRGHHAWLLDDRQREVPDGESGELCIGGPGVARGYRGLEELTRERFPLHPTLGRIYRTGDLARRDANQDLFYLGRLDAQVKLRGYRIELPAVEARLSACDGVREAACRVQDRLLVAFVVPEDADAPPAADALAAALRATLPPYMVPARFGVLARLPTTVGGKLDRAALPRLEAPSREGVVAPRDAIEHEIARAVAAALNVADISVEDDFFTDLGGDSLAAAVAISALRAGFQLAVRDVYEARTVAALAERARHLPKPSAPAQRESQPRIRTGPATAVQCSVLFAELVAGTGVAYLIAFRLLPFLLRALGIYPFLFVLPVLAFVAALAYTPVALALAVVIKRTLIGTYRPLRAPAWGSYHVRHWVVQRAARLVPWGLLQGTVFLNAALRALGARIGRRVHIDRGVALFDGGWDLLAIGDDATIRRDAALRVVELENGEVVFDAITVGAGATVDVRAGMSGASEIEDGSLLTALSWLPPQSRIPSRARWDGVPAEPAGAAPTAAADPGDGLAPPLHGVLTVLARFALAYLTALPALGLFALLAARYAMNAERALDWLYAPSLQGCLPLLGAIVVAAVLALVANAATLRMLGRASPGQMSRWSLAYLRVTLKIAGLESAGNRLSGTLLWPRWLRLAGMHVGPDCEISTITDTVPELLKIGGASFLADGIYLGGPRVHRGVVTIAATRLGSATFLGNHVVVPAGAQLPDDYFLGVCTVADAAIARSGSAWFGHPAFELPRRAVVTADRRLTHAPGLARRATRWLFELARFALPVGQLLLALGWFKALASIGVAGAAFWLVAAPGVSLAAAVTACAVVLAMKWLMLGRVRPAQHALWSCWCSRWDFLYVAWGALARPVLATLEGTLLLGWYLRAMGARVGRGVLLDGGFAQVVDPDMLRFDDGSTVSALFQAHSFEDRVLKIDHVHIGSHSTVGAGSVLLYGADIGERATVAPHSVVMKHEHLLPNHRYAGCPTR